MKIISKEEFDKKLIEILSYDINAIAVLTKESENIEKNNHFTVVECLGLDTQMNSILLDIADVNHITNNKDLLVMHSSEQFGLNSPQEAIKQSLQTLKKMVYL